MEIKEIIANIRKEEGLTQAQLAKKLYVTRQAVSKWERGEGTPDLEILKKISDTFQFSMDYLTGKTTERKGVVCQSCGMLIKDETQKGTEKKGEKSDTFCFYCYRDGQFTQNCTVEEMAEKNLGFLNEWNKEMGTNFTLEEARAALKEYLPSLQRGKK